jgi:hypothetical protein
VISIPLGLQTRLLKILGNSLLELVILIVGINEPLLQRLNIAILRLDLRTCRISSISIRAQNKPNLFHSTVGFNPLSVRPAESTVKLLYPRLQRPRHLLVEAGTVRWCRSVPEWIGLQ